MEFLLCAGFFAESLSDAGRHVIILFCLSVFSIFSCLFQLTDKGDP